MFFLFQIIIWEYLFSISFLRRHRLLSLFARESNKIERSEENKKKEQNGQTVKEGRVLIQLTKNTTRVKKNKKRAYYGIMMQE